MLVMELEPPTTRLRSISWVQCHLNTLLKHLTFQSYPDSNAIHFLKVLPMLITKVNNKHTVK